MKALILISLVVFAATATAHAEIIPLNCTDYVALTETAVNERDKSLTKKQTLEFLGGDEFMSNRDKKVVRQMIERVYAHPREGVNFHVAQTRKECTFKLRPAQ